MKSGAGPEAPPGPTVAASPPIASLPVEAPLGLVTTDPAVAASPPIAGLPVKAPLGLVTTDPAVAVNPKVGDLSPDKIVTMVATQAVGAPIFKVLLVRVVGMAGEEQVTNPTVAINPQTMDPTPPTRISAGQHPPGLAGYALLLGQHPTGGTALLVYQIRGNGSTNIVLLAIVVLLPSELTQTMLVRTLLSTLIIVVTLVV